ncbi:hypothetical protein JB92DRAFT_3106403 [Gautieria morchelliformis]|nr:hypothetical protein JB92DRAFT_3106403 [Gautieria morchelliformis]
MLLPHPSTPIRASPASSTPPQAAQRVFPLREAPTVPLSAPPMLSLPSTTSLPPSPTPVPQPPQNSRPQPLPQLQLATPRVPPSPPTPPSPPPTSVASVVSPQSAGSPPGSVVVRAGTRPPSIASTGSSAVRYTSASRRPRARLRGPSFCTSTRSIGSASSPQEGEERPSCSRGRIEPEGSPKYDSACHPAPLDHFFDISMLFAALAVGCHQARRLPIISTHAILPVLPPPSTAWTMAKCSTSFCASSTAIRVPTSTPRPRAAPRRTALPHVVDPLVYPPTTTESVKTPTVAQVAHIRSAGEGDPHESLDERAVSPAPLAGIPAPRTRDGAPTPTAPTPTYASDCPDEAQSHSATPTKEDNTAWGIKVPPRTAASTLPHSQQRRTRDLARHSCRSSAQSAGGSPHGSVVVRAGPRPPSVASTASSAVRYASAEPPSPPPPETDAFGSASSSEEGEPVNHPTLVIPLPFIFCSISLTAVCGVGCCLSPGSTTVHHINPRDPAGAAPPSTARTTARCSTSFRASSTAIRVPTSTPRPRRSLTSSIRSCTRPRPQSLSRPRPSFRWATAHIRSAGDGDSHVSLDESAASPAPLAPTPAPRIRNGAPAPTAPTRVRHNANGSLRYGAHGTYGEMRTIAR